MDIPAGTHARVEANRRRYDQLVALTRRYAQEGRTEQVLQSAMVAAHFAWVAPIGLLNDAELERLVVDAVRQGGDVRLDSARSTGRVLHVLTEGYDLGGHTRLAWRWIERDSRISDVALSGQRAPAPEELLRSVRSSGGQVLDLAEAHSALLARARALRRLMDRADVVVLHVHPYDVVALAAVNLPGPRPPVVFENHADHTFWLGLGSADLIADNRATAARICREMRAVRPERLGLLPLAIDPARPSTNRKVTRGRLGVRPTQVMALTVAGGRKTEPVWGRGFAEVLHGALQRCPELAVVVVGLPSLDRWRQLQAAFPHRVFPLPPRRDVDALFAAADLYLDAFPVSGGTALLEAAVAGLPVLGLQPDGEHGYVYQADAPGLDPDGHVFTGEDRFHDAVAALVSDPELRRLRGEQDRQAVLDAHGGSRWREDLENLYRRAADAPIADLDEYRSPVPVPGYAASLAAMLQDDDGTPDPVPLLDAVGEGLDAGLRLDLFALSARDLGPCLQVRVAPGWNAHPAWMVRLTALAAQYPRLAVSLPFVAGDDARGSRSVAALEPVLAANGLTTATCGALSLDVERPAAAGPSVSDELPPTAGALDMLESLVRSPCWADLAVGEAVPADG